MTVNDRKIKGKSKKAKGKSKKIKSTKIPSWEGSGVGKLKAKVKRQK